MLVGACDNKIPDAEIFFEESKALELAQAIERSDTKTIRQHASTIDINKQHVRGMTFLNWAFAHLKYESAETLVELGADPHIETEGISPLSWAMDFKDIRWLKLLIESGADFNTKSKKSPLWFDTIVSENWQHFDYLLKEGVNIDATNEIGETVIFELAAYRAYGQLLKLVENGADIHIVTVGGLSFARQVQNREVPSDHPEFENREKIIKLLEKEGYRFPVPSAKETREQWAK